MKKTLLFILSLICVLYLNAQQTITAEESIKNIQTRQIRAIELDKLWEQGRTEREKIAKEKREQEMRTMRNAEFVFEGYVIKSAAYYYTYSNGKLSYRYSTIINITKVFKGNLQLGTIELIREINSFSIGEPDRKTILVNDLVPSIYFTHTASQFLKEEKYNIDRVDNNTIITYYDDNIDFYRCENQLWRNSVDDNYITKDSLYNYLRKIDGLNIPKETIQVQSTIKENSIKQINDELLELKKSPKKSQMPISSISKKQSKK